MGKASPLTSLTLFILGILCNPFALLVESQKQQNGPRSAPPPPPPPPSPPPFSPPPSPPPPPPPPPPVPPRLYDPRGSDRTTRRHPPPPPSPSPSPSPPPPLRSKPKPKLNPNPKKMNTGKKIGLLFAGIAAILQIGVVGFLAFKRRQLLQVRDRYETFTS